MIEELKRNIKMSKYKENESDLKAYAEECFRLRNLLAKTLND